MTRPRTTSGKYQRQEQKRAKARAKTERRDARKSTASEEPEAPVGTVDEGHLMNELASLHQSLEAGDLQIPEFEERREQIRTQLERLQ